MHPCSKILLTGGTSFTGLHFARELAGHGFDVTAVCPRPRAAYAALGNLRGRRAALLADAVACVWDAPVGSPRFLDLCASRDWAVFCHHAAQVEGYARPDFDAAAAAAANTDNLASSLAAMPALRAIVATGSVFEAGQDGRPISPYGLSKQLTWRIVRRRACERHVPAVKFVMPNPIGRWEEPRFVASLVADWRERRLAAVQQPAVVRDEVPVPLLARRYRNIVQLVCEGALPTGWISTPSCWYDTRAAFAERVATYFRPRTGWDCDYLPGLDRTAGVCIPRGEHAVRFVSAAAQAAFWDGYAEWYATPPPAPG